VIPRARRRRLLECCKSGDFSTVEERVEGEEESPSRASSMLQILQSFLVEEVLLSHLGSALPRLIVCWNSSAFFSTREPSAFSRVLFYSYNMM
jgi:hypothetical protein